jgi:hypothetical protein
MRLVPLAFLSIAACTQQKSAIDDSFQDLAGMDQKADSFSYRMKIVGSLDYGQTSASVSYTKTPRYRAFKFAGSEHDNVDVWVKSTDGGDAVAWVLDNGFHVLGSNDDAEDGSTDSHVKLVLPASSSATHYVVFRDYSTSTAHFTVELGGGPPYDTSCATDDDCVAVPAGGCCPDGRDAAVNKDSVDAYAAATACTEPPQVCPLHVILETRVAQCNRDTSTCEMIEPTDIRCGGFIAHPHECPAHYTCHYDGVPDIPGHCQHE